MKFPAEAKLKFWHFRADIAFGWASSVSDIRVTMLTLSSGRIALMKMMVIIMIVLSMMTHKSLHAFTKGWIFGTSNMFDVICEKKEKEVKTVIVVQ